jgi:hypothetical protein
LPVPSNRSPSCRHVGGKHQGPPVLGHRWDMAHRTTADTSGFQRFAHPAVDLGKRSRPAVLDDFGVLSHSRGRSSTSQWIEIRLPGRERPAPNSFVQPGRLASMGGDDKPVGQTVTHEPLGYLFVRPVTEAVKWPGLQLLHGAPPLPDASRLARESVRERRDGLVRVGQGDSKFVPSGAEDRFHHRIDWKDVEYRRADTIVGSSLAPARTITAIQCDEYHEVAVELTHDESAIIICGPATLNLDPARGILFGICSKYVMPRKLVCALKLCTPSNRRRPSTKYSAPSDSRDVSSRAM